MKEEEALPAPRSARAQDPVAGWVCAGPPGAPAATSSPVQGPAESGRPPDPAPAGLPGDQQRAGTGPGLGGA